MACECITCPECKGSGIVWFAFGGEYLGNHRCDDLNDYESCHQCGGYGLDFLCDECAEAMDREMEEGY